MRQVAAVFAAVFAAVIALGGCTGSAPTEVSSSPRSRAVPSHVAVEGRTFDVSCTPVAEALVDIKLPRAPGDPQVRAITGLWDRQAVAVLANDRPGCGVWTLAIARDVSERTVDQIRQEVAAGVERFGVTASPVPRDETGG
jgi:hypothetical protein